MKICIIGHGYWGNILHKNIMELGHNDIQLIDIKLNNTHLLDDRYDIYFVTTPFSTHYDILLKLSEYKNKKIWCEKPLVETTEKLTEIYKLMEINNNKLFVDWVYTFNNCVRRLKEILSTKKVKQIILNRTNDGPKRYDCNSVYDLSSHDISILFYLYPELNLNFTFNEHSNLQNEKFGSNLSWCYEDNTQIILNSSWQHTSKNRISIFVTQDDEVILFDDIKKQIFYNESFENFSEKTSPIHSALNFFFSSNEFNENKNLTSKITKILQKSWT
jgi:predicted dehydrogenase